MPPKTVKRGVGRPALPVDEVRGAHIGAKFSALEMAEIEAYRNRQTVPPRISDIIRAGVLAIVRGEKP